ncbi:MAG: NAD(P)-dependent oxidoreductase [Bacillota bacterium]|nr:MAG: NAD(P)-dependent oxidoreductase [Bacillota bacterium]
MQIAFLGLGAMGAPMARNLIRAGYRLTVWNRTPERAAPLVAEGARQAPTPREAAAGCGVIITMLADPDAVRGVAGGPDGLLAGAARGAIWIDASTIGPTAARELAAQAAGYGVRFLDAPVLGSVPQAEAGELVFLVGGDREVLEEVRPVLSAMGRAIHHMGVAGQGAAAKIVSNMLTGAYLELLGEGLGLAERLGLDREQMLELIRQGPFGAPILERKVEILRTGTFRPAHFYLRLMRKDLELALAESQRVGLPVPSARSALGVYRDAEVAGRGDEDFAAVVDFAAAGGRPAGAPADG